MMSPPTATQSDIELLREDIIELRKTLPNTSEMGEIILDTTNLTLEQKSLEWLRNEYPKSIIMNYGPFYPILERLGDI